MRILIVEMHLTGHHPIYLDRIVMAILRAGHHVVVVVPESEMRHPVLTAGMALFPGSLECLPFGQWEVDRSLSPRFGAAGRDLRVWMLWRRTFRQVGRPIDLVLVPYIDYAMQSWLALGSPFGRTPWLAVTMRTGFHHHDVGVTPSQNRWDMLRRFLFLRGIKRAQQAHLLTIDPLLKPYLLARHPRVAHKVGYLADPSDPPVITARQRARSTIGLRPDVPIVLVYGVIDRRKSIDLLIEAAASQGKEAVNPDVVIAGRFDDWARQFVQDSPSARALADTGRLTCLDALIGDELEALLFSAVDIVWLKYRNHRGMSGVMIKAAAAGLPIIVGKWGLMERFTRDYGLGVVLEGDAIEPVREAIGAIEAIKLACDAGKRSVVVEAHSWSNFERAIVSAVNGLAMPRVRCAELELPGRA